MILTSRFCVELDKCPECEAIWLDCGEIEKIADRNNIGNELYERNQSEKNNVCDGQDKGYFFTRMNTVKMPPMTRCSILNDQS